MNRHINKALTDYISIKDPQYAVMLTGEWGCGKSYFIKKWIESQSKSCEQEDTVLLNPIYVSLFGINSLADVNKAIVRELHPFFYTKTGKLINGFVRIASKTIIKSEISLNQEDKIETTYSLDSLSLLRAKSDLLSGNKILVFDDLERCLIDKKLLLGLFNYLVEHCGCHVVLICNRTKLSDGDKESFDEIQEKTIGRVFEIMSDVNSALDAFLDTNIHCAFITTRKEWIKTCFDYTGYGNLRILRQCLYDFSNQLLKLEDSNSVYSHEAFFNTLLAAFIAVYAELGQKNHAQYLNDLIESFNFTFYLDNDATNDPVINLYNKYAGLGNFCLENPLNPSMVKNVVNYHTKGISCVSFIKENINKTEKEYSIVEQLQSFRTLENQSFKTACDRALNLLSEPNVDDAFRYGKIISYFLHFEQENIRPLSSSDWEVIENNGFKLIDNCQDLNQIYKCYRLFLEGIGSCVTKGFSNKKYDIIFDNWKRHCDERSTMFPDEMQEVLRNLSDSNVDLLAGIEQKAYVDQSSTYHLKAIFIGEDADKIFHSLEQMTNAGRTQFVAFLSYHYRDIEGLKHRYKDDLPFLDSFISLVENKIQNTELVEKYSYISLNSVLEKVLQVLKG